MKWTIWILIADRGRARVFSQEAAGDSWNKEASFDFPEGRQREGETKTDRPSLFSAQGENRYSPEPHVDHRHTTAAAFSKELIGHLDHGRQENRFDELWVVAPPLFLGELRNHMSSRLTEKVTREWHKDLTNFPDTVIQQEVERLVAHDKAP